MSPIQQALRACADTAVTPMTPHWVDNARRLMRQAADALDAAEEAMAAAQAPAVGAPANLERDYARALDAIKGHVERIKVLEQQARELQAFKDGVELHQRGGSNSWYWLDDRENYLETMVASLPVVIRAEQLRALLSQPPVQGSGQ